MFSELPLVVFWIISPMLVAGECFPGDGDGDTDVDFADLAAMQICFTGEGGTLTSGCEPFDFDGDEDVALDDFAEYLGAVTGPLVPFDYGPSPRPDAEAEQLALETFPSLLATDEEYGRIRRDLAAIRNLQPLVATVIHDPRWLPSQMLAKLDEALPWCDFDALNAFYQVTSVNLLFSSGGFSWFVVHYPGRLNIPLLATLYEPLPEVALAEPDALIGTDDRIVITFAGAGTWIYDIDDGFLDCFDGCDCHIYWTFEVTEAGQVTQTHMECTGMPWCVFPPYCNP